MAQEALEPGALPSPTKLNPVKGADGVWRLSRVRHRTFSGHYVRTSGSGRTRKECLADWNAKFEVNRHKRSARKARDGSRDFELGDKMSKVFAEFYRRQEKRCAAGKISEQTLESYWFAIYEATGPGADPDAVKLERELGHLTIGEVGKPKFLADYLEDIADVTPGIAARQHLILGVSFKMLTLAGLFDFSPMAPVPQPYVGGGKQRALTPAERDQLYELLEGRKRGAKYLLPLVLTLLGTGIRTGEALALRWMDIAGLDDETVDNAIMHVCGTVVGRKGHRCVRQPKRKCGQSYYVALPRWLTGVLRTHKAAARAAGRSVEGESPLFVSSWGGMVASRTAENALRNARAGTSLEWLKFGNFRDTVATQVKGKTGDPARASAQLGHSAGSTVTTRHYIDPDGFMQEVVDNAEVLESLCPSKVGTMLESGVGG